MSSRGTEPTAGAARLGTWLRDKYRLDRVLGVGGMAVVYAATHRNKKRFAVKMLNLEFSSHREMHARFLREGYVANSVEHPGAVAVLDDDVAEDGSAFLVMELLEGNTLEGLCEQSGGKLDPRLVLALAHQVLDTLAAAHAKHVIHRDIKPANLFVTDDGTVKVLDFGIARLREAGASSSNTATGLYLGTPSFMSPEQASGRASQVDERSDLWSVGATLFSILAGRDVHVGETPQHMVLLAATTPAPALASILPGVAPAVASVVDRAVALDKNDRWSSAAAMRAAVAAAYQEIAGEPVSPRLLAERVSVGKRAPEPHRSLAPESMPTWDPGSAPTLPSASQPDEAVSVAPRKSPVVAATMDPVSSSPSSGTRNRYRIVAMTVVVGLGVATVSAALLRTRQGSTTTHEEAARTVASDPAPSPPAPSPSPTPVAATPASEPSASVSSAASSAEAAKHPATVHPSAAPRPTRAPSSGQAAPPSAKATGKSLSSAPCSLVETVDKTGESHFSCPCATCQ